MINDKTTHIELPKPHVKNLLKDDVDRIRQAFDLVDSALHAIGEASEKPLKELQKEMTAIKPVVERLRNLSDVLLIEPEAVEVNYNAAGQVEKITEVIDGQSKITTVVYSGQKISSYHVEFLGEKKNYIIGYNSAGQLTGVNI